MLRSPGSSRPARPFVPEEIELKLALLGARLQWEHGTRAFLVTFPGAPVLGMAINGDAVETLDDWSRVVSDIADRLVKARVPVGHLSKLSRIEPVVIEAAAVIEEENFK